MNNHYIAEPGKIFKTKLNETLLGEELYLGIYDSIDNYEQVDYIGETTDVIPNEEIIENE